MKKKDVQDMGQSPVSQKPQKYTKSQKELLSSLNEMSTRPLVEVMQGMETLLVYASNLILFPDEKKYRKVKVTNIHYQERLGHLPGAKAAMGAIGYKKIGEYLRLDEKKLKTDGSADKLVELQKLLTQRLDEVRSQFKDLPNRVDATHVFTSVSGVGTHSDIGKRNNMEDDEIVIDSFCGNEHMGYFALYDGHGGRETVNFVVKVMHMNLESQLKMGSSWEEALKKAYLATDGQLRKQGILRSGSTSVTCVLQYIESSNKKILHTANVGDSRAVLCRKGKAIRLSVDHKPNLPDEQKRILEAGGFVGRNNRVNGVLAISRALGDHMLKERGVVSAEPHYAATELILEDTYLILACDGVWDVMNDQEAVDITLAQMKQHTISTQSESKEPEDGKSINIMLQLTAKRIVREALERRTLDNVTVTIVKL